MSCPVCQGKMSANIFQPKILICPRCGYRTGDDVEQCRKAWELQCPRQAQQPTEPEYNI